MYNKEFKFNKDGEFKILIFTDIHEKYDIESKKGKIQRYFSFYKHRIGHVKAGLSCSRSI